MSGGAWGQNGARYEGPMPPPLPGSAPGAAMGPAAPPTHPGMLARPPRAPVWPTSIGIVTIVFASLGMLRSAYSGAAPWLFDKVGRMVQAANPAFDPFAGMRVWQAWITLVHAALVVVAAGLIAGGSGVMQRRRWGVWVVVCCAGARIALAVGEAFVSAGVQEAQMRMMMNQPGGAYLSAFGSGMAWFGAVISIGWYSVFPAFLLIWFVSAPIRRDVRAWTDAGVVKPRVGDFPTSV